MATPTIVLVHGLWGDAAHWSKVIVELARRGYTSQRAVELPLISLGGDVTRVEQVLDQIEGPVVLVGHSYGGVVITAAGAKPNVSALVYVAALVPDAGESAAVLSEAQPGSAFGAVYPDAHGYLWLADDQFHEAFAHDVDADEALVMAVTQKAPVAALLGESIGEPAWKVKPSYYQLSTEDRVVHPENQRRMADRIGPKSIVELPSSHASAASHPVEIADLIERAAQETA